MRGHGERGSDAAAGSRRRKEEEEDDCHRKLHLAKSGEREEENFLTVAIL
jgi:hypothetical protein